MRSRDMVWGGVEGLRMDLVNGDEIFPLTPALSLGERENCPPRFRQSRATRLVAARDAVFPLPGGEGQGEGEGDGGDGECFADLGGPIVILLSILRIHQHVSKT